MGYYLKRLNLSIWFGYVPTLLNLYGTNSLENYNNFTGININMLSKKFNGDENLIRNYLDGWICYSLFIKDIVRQRLNWNQTVNLLYDYLKIN